MSNKQNTAALRSEAANIIGLLTAEGHQSFTLDKAADFFDDVFRQLEAERQRAEDMTVSRDAMTDKRDTALAKVYELEAEILKLKGEQVPMFLKQTGIGSNGCQGSYKEYVTIDEGEYEENPAKHLKLFTAPQKPIVLPHGYKPYLVRSQTTATRAAMTSGGDWLHRDEVTAAIEAAGGIVKDGE